jgi:hypothetical protein
MGSCFAETKPTWFEQNSINILRRSGHRGRECHTERSYKLYSTTEEKAYKSCPSIEIYTIEAVHGVKRAHMFYQNKKHREWEHLSTRRKRLDSKENKHKNSQPKGGGEIIGSIPRERRIHRLAQYPSRVKTVKMATSLQSRDRISSLKFRTH